MPEFRHIALEHLARMKGKVALAVLCLLLYTGAELLEPWSFKIIFDHVLLGHQLPPGLALLQPLLDRGPGPAILVLSLLIIVVALVQGVATYFRVATTATIGYEIVYRVRSELYAHVQRLSLRFHSRARSGELLTKVTSDTNVLKEIFGDTLLVFATDALTLVGMTVVMWRSTGSSHNRARHDAARVRVHALVVARIKVSAAAQRRREGRSPRGSSETLLRAARASLRPERARAAAFDDQARVPGRACGRREPGGRDEGDEAARRHGQVGRRVRRRVEDRAGLMLPGDLLVFWAYMGKMYKPLQDLATTWGIRQSVDERRPDQRRGRGPDIRIGPGPLRPSTCAA
jgi:ATP-binding cassette subfamily B protein/subfamily B ATP-binding cassette protein MsbA